MSLKNFFSKFTYTDVETMSINEEALMNVEVKSKLGITLRQLDAMSIKDINKINKKVNKKFFL